MDISIHALTRSATKYSHRRNIDEGISIHALTRSATFIEVLRCLNVGISIHALTRSATEVGDNLFRYDAISIHALTRSATWSAWHVDYLWLDFNPRTHEECDWMIQFKKCQTLYFNPRTHEECDINMHSYRYLYNISIHALTRSATNDLTSLLAAYIFQSTHSRGVRPKKQTSQ